MENKHVYKNIDLVHVCKSGDGKCRYFLDLTLKKFKHPWTLVALMKSPSEANDSQSDQTVNTLLNGLDDRYKRVIIVNTTPLIIDDETPPKDRTAEVQKYAAENKQMVAMMIQDAKKFHLLVATGELETGVNDELYPALMSTIDELTTIGDGLFVVNTTHDNHGVGILRSKQYLQNSYLSRAHKVDDDWHLELVETDENIPDPKEDWWEQHMVIAK